MATELRSVLRYTQDGEAGGEATAAEEEQRAEERVCSPGGTRQEAQQDTQTMHGPAGAPAGAAERHSGVARPPQNSHQVDPTRPAHPGHHDDHRHHRHVAALTVLDQIHQHRRRRHPPGPLGHAPADKPQPGRRQHLAPPTRALRFSTEGSGDDFFSQKILMKSLYPPHDSSIF